MEWLIGVIIFVIVFGLFIGLWRVISGIILRRRAASQKSFAPVVTTLSTILRPIISGAIFSSVSLTALYDPVLDKYIEAQQPTFGAAHYSFNRDGMLVENESVSSLQQNADDDATFYPTFTDPTKNPNYTQLVNVKKEVERFWQSDTIISKGNGYKKKNFYKVKDGLVSTFRYMQQALFYLDEHLNGRFSKFYSDTPYNKKQTAAEYFKERILAVSAVHNDVLKQFVDEGEGAPTPKKFFKKSDGLFNSVKHEMRLLNDLVDNWTSFLKEHSKELSSNDDVLFIQPKSPLNSEQSVFHLAAFHTPQLTGKVTAEAEINGVKYQGEFDAEVVKLINDIVTIIKKIAFKDFNGMIAEIKRYKSPIH